MKTIGLDAEVVVSKFEESLNSNLSVKELVMELAYGKANDVASHYNEGIVIGADTIVVIDGKKIGKPQNHNEAFETLKLLSGRTHEVISGIVLINCKTKEIIKDCEITKVTFKELNDKEIQQYINLGEPFGKAGSYGIQGPALAFVEKIEGCYPNIMGLPVNNLLKNLKKMNVDFLEQDAWKAKNN